MNDNHDPGIGHPAYSSWKRQQAEREQRETTIRENRQRGHLKLIVDNTKGHYGH